MANVDAAFGAIPIKHLDGAPYNGMVNEYSIPAADGTAVYLGDFVKSAGSADTDGVPDVAQAAAGDALLGVVVGFRADPSDLTLQYRKASTLRYALVADAPDVIVAMQEDSDGGALAVADVGNNADIIVAAGSTVTGRSKMEVDSSTKATTTAQVRVLRLYKNSENATGNQAIWECMVNEHEHKSTTGT